MSCKAMGNFSVMSHIPSAENLGFSQGRKFENQALETPPSSSAPCPLVAGISPCHSHCCPWTHQVKPQASFLSQPAFVPSRQEGQLLRLSSSCGCHCPQRTGRHNPVQAQGQGTSDSHSSWKQNMKDTGWEGAVATKFKGCVHKVKKKFFSSV